MRSHAGDAQRREPARRRRGCLAWIAFIGRHGLLELDLSCLPSRSYTANCSAANFSVSAGVSTRGMLPARSVAGDPLRIFRRDLQRRDPALDELRAHPRRAVERAPADDRLELRVAASRAVGTSGRSFSARAWS